MYFTKNAGFRNAFGSSLLSAFVLFGAVGVSAQNIAINSDGALPDKNAMLDIKSNTKGLLIPRMTTDARLRIQPTQGLMVYDINTNSFWYNDGKAWKNMSAADVSLAATGAWMLTGNAGTTDVANFLGTTDNVPLNIRVNNQQSGRIDGTLANTYWGFRSGFNITTGNDNTGIGASALFTNTTGYNNTAVGSNALQSNTTGHHNSALGRMALLSNLTGYNNTAAGITSLFSNTTGYDNTAIGTGAMYNNSTGYWNTVMGAYALQRNSAGSMNTAIGNSAAYQVEGNNNTAIGATSLHFQVSGDANTAVGKSAMHAGYSGSNNTALGHIALASNAQGNFNTAVGAEALASNNASGNTATGYRAMYHNTRGEANTAHGNSALLSNSTATANTAIGFRSLFSFIGGPFGNGVNTGCGSFTLTSTTTGWGNAAFGSDALIGNSTGFWNTSVGGGSSYFSSVGNYNTAVGTTALFGNSDGSQNVAIGVSALSNNRSGNGNTAIGVDANTSSNNLVNAIALGYNAIVNASNKVRIGNAAVTVIEGQVPFTFPSDGRYKFQVQEDVKGLDFILQLRPVTYRFDTKRFDEQLTAQLQQTNNSDTEASGKWVAETTARKMDLVMDAAYSTASSIRRSGFIAQEVEQAAKRTGYNFSGVISPGKEQQHYSLSYDAFVVPLVKAVQEQQQLIDKQQKHILDQDKKMAEIQEQLNEIKALLKTSK